MSPLAISAYTTTSAVGPGLEALQSALRQQRSGLRPGVTLGGTELPGHAGAVASLEDQELPGPWSRFDCRNNRLAWLALEQDGFLERARQLISDRGPARVGLFLGTSTSGIGQTERAFRDAAVDGFTSMPAWYDYRHTHNVHSAGQFLSEILGCKGPSYTISTACSSSAKVFATAARAIRAGLCDAAIVGGVDSLCLTTLFGFHALQLISPGPCRPADRDRQGISIGEAAGFAIVEPENNDHAVQLLGYGESSDAYHMSSPDPDGRGAYRAMADCLARADRDAREVDYVNLHGTGTPANDAAEDQSIYRMFGGDTPCSSTKGWTGHCLGAAGILESIIAMLCIERGWVLPSLNTETVDPAFRCRIPLQLEEQEVRIAMSNSFGFGGTNCSLLFGGAS